MSLATPLSSFEKLQNALHVKAKTEPKYRFYSLWDKICRSDVLSAAYDRCRANKGVAGFDGVSFDDIEKQGKEQWLGTLQAELRDKTYKLQPLLRVWIPKANGGQRPLGIATIKDRVAQLACMLILEPIFEADLPPNQYGFRRSLDAKLALRRAFYHITKYGRTEVVDADLSDYFSSIPHGPLMKCVSRRIADGQILAILKLWIEMPVVERNGRKLSRITTEAKDTHRGTPQGSPCSPLLANLYFRRFILAWDKFGYSEELDAKIVNYADDFVICIRPGSGEQAMKSMRQLMNRLGLQINEKKTRLVSLPTGEFDFLGYTVGRQYKLQGQPFIGTKPSKRSVQKVMAKIHDETSVRWNMTTPEERVLQLNRIVRGWANYFNQGPVLSEYRKIQGYMNRRLQLWLVRKFKQRGRGYRQYPDNTLYEKYGLIKLPANRAELSRAKT